MPCPSLTLRILSDLHLEASGFSIPELPGDEDCVLILAGDIAPFRMPALREFLCDASKQFMSVLMVPGNHEWYHGTFPADLQRFKSKGLPKNVHLTDQGIIFLEGVTFLMTTLWSDFDQGNPISMFRAQQIMSDYEQIATPRPACEFLGAQPGLTPDDTLRAHRQSRQWLEDEMRKFRESNSPGRLVVVTHHAPLLQSIDPMYRNSSINGAFASNLEPLFYEYAPDLIIHGHTHTSFDYVIKSKNGKNMRVVANPRGYANQMNHHPENTFFSSLFEIAI